MDIQSLSRSELEEYAEQLEREKDVLLEAVDLAEEHIRSSAGTHSEILDKIQEVQRETGAEPTHYDTTGVKEVMNELEDMVDEHTE
ncbi:hypothetical protein SAMN05216226_1236 [Halovenus aranensis]|uniref:Uncharacterized protein n=1 Tax=Halovenus aranensis TaxID=890420 RepID=A0A1G8ZFW4_9EURY|nr:hypothetical protein [Halovenus aranensis]SDK13999.1 hypothetical protein SAMN05216226_1236 [Halovenus aranensis]